MTTSVNNIVRLLFVFYFTLSPVSSIGQAIAEKKELTDIAKVHTWISEMKSANISWLDAPENHVYAQQYRAAVGISDIHHTLIVEKIVYGKEGCCKKVANMWSVDLWDVYKKYDVSPETPVTLDKWVTDRRLIFVVGGKPFIIELTDDDWRITLARNDE